MADKPTLKSDQPMPRGESRSEVWTPPSQMPPPQYPVIKPGEPIPYGERPAASPEATKTQPPVPQKAR
jgi:hypothetical protein